VSYSFPENPISTIGEVQTTPLFTEDAKDLISKLLVRDPK
jgi:hypothetical protein